MATKRVLRSDNSCVSIFHQTNCFIYYLFLSVFYLFTCIYIWTASEMKTLINSKQNIKKMFSLTIKCLK